MSKNKRSINLEKKANSHVGKKYNHLKILSTYLVDCNGKGYRKCYCVCSCGRSASRDLHHVINGTSKCCGCKVVERRTRSINRKYKGKVYGNLKVLTVYTPEFNPEYPTRERKRLFLCQCSCGNKSTHRYTSVTSGKARSCGCKGRKRKERSI